MLMIQAQVKWENTRWCSQGLPGGAAVKNPPANAGNKGSEEQDLPSHRATKACARQQKSSPCPLQLEKAQAQEQRPHRASVNKQKHVFKRYALL